MHRHPLVTLVMSSYQTRLLTDPSNSTTCCNPLISKGFLGSVYQQDGQKVEETSHYFYCKLKKSRDEVTFKGILVNNKNLTMTAIMNNKNYNYMQVQVVCLV